MKIRLIARRALAAGLVLGVAAGINAQPADSAKQTRDRNTSGWSEIHQTMMKGMKDMEKMSSSGDVDRDFAMLMKMHHQSGIDMAIAHLRHGNDARMRDMAEKTIKEQRKEVKELDQWLAANDKRGRPSGDRQDRKKGQ